MSKDQTSKAAFEKGLKGEPIGQVTTGDAFVALVTLGFGNSVPTPTSEEKSAYEAGKAIHDKR